MICYSILKALDRACHLFDTIQLQIVRIANSSKEIKITSFNSTFAHPYDSSPVNNYLDDLGIATCLSPNKIVKMQVLECKQM